MLPLAAVHNQVKADAKRSAHLQEKAEGARIRELVWVNHGQDHFVAEVPGGAYVLRKVDSGSRVKRYRFRWKALWAPKDSPDVRELALERQRGWAQGAAEVHNKRRQQA